MSIFKEVWEFTESNGAGFNEVWYSQSDSINKASSFQAEFINKRLRLLHPLNTFQRIRVSQVGQNRLTSQFAVARPGLALTPDGPLAVGAAIVCSLAGSQGGSRKLWLRGSIDQWYSRDPVTGQDAPPAPLLIALKSFFDNMAANLYGINRLTPGAAQGQAGIGTTAVYKIVSVDGTIQDGTAVLEFAPQWTPPAPGRLVIGGASKKDLPGLNGHWSSYQTATGKTAIPYQTPQGQNIPAQGAHVKSEIYQTFSVFNAAACGFSHYGTRTSRNPLSHSRGARRAVRLRQSR